MSVHLVSSSFFCDLSHSKRTVTRLTMILPWIWVSTWFFIFEKHVVHCTYVAQTSRPCVFEQRVILEQPLEILGKFVRLVVLFLRITVLPLQQLKDTKGLVLQTMSSLRSVCVSFSTFMWPILEELRAQNIQIKNNMPPEGRPTFVSNDFLWWLWECRGSLKISKRTFA